MSRARELNPDVRPEIGGLLRNMSESGTDKGLNRMKASSQGPDGGYVGGQRISGGHRTKDGRRPKAEGRRPKDKGWTRDGRRPKAEG
jgi:hypothetical protein